MKACLKTKAVCSKQKLKSWRYDAVCFFFKRCLKARKQHKVWIIWLPLRWGYQGPQISRGSDRAEWTCSYRAFTRRPLLFLRREAKPWHHTGVCHRLQDAILQAGKGRLLCLSPCNYIILHGKYAYKINNIKTQLIIIWHSSIWMQECMDS